MNKIKMTGVFSILGMAVPTGYAIKLGPYKPDNGIPVYKEFKINDELTVGTPTECHCLNKDIIEPFAQHLVNKGFAVEVV